MTTPPDAARPLHPLECGPHPVMWWGLNIATQLGIALCVALLASRLPSLVLPTVRMGALLKAVCVAAVAAAVLRWAGRYAARQAWLHVPGAPGGRGVCDETAPTVALWPRLVDAVGVFVVLATPPVAMLVLAGPRPARAAAACGWLVFYLAYWLVCAVIARALPAPLTMAARAVVLLAVGVAALLLGSPLSPDPAAAAVRGAWSAVILVTLAMQLLAALWNGTLPGLGNPPA